MQALDRKFIKTYDMLAAKRTFKYTTTVRHKGTVIAFAMDDQQAIYYSVLDLDRKLDSNLDVNFWDINPQELRFPQELNRVGFSTAGLTTMPTVRKGGGDINGALKDEEKDFFLSTTARLTTDAPFQVLSDERHVYVFRQSIDERDARNLVDQGRALVNSVLLVDRFVFADRLLKPKLETRFQRSRKKDQPDSAKDSLGYEDLEKKLFYEPTQALTLVRHMIRGWFSVLLLPTRLPDVQRWQIFAYNGRTSRMDSFNIERSQDGLFNTRGTRYYTSPEPAHQKDVFERNPGIDPFTGKALVPISSQSGAAESALAFNGVSDFVMLPSADSINHIDDFTIELWLKVDPDQVGSENMCWILDKGTDAGFYQFLLYYLKDSGKLVASRSGNSKLPQLVSDRPINDGKFHHIAYVKSGLDLALYIDGVKSAQTIDTAGQIKLIANNSAPMYLGCRGGSRSFLKGEIDELRIWSRARSLDEILETKHHRLIGNEIQLEGYWRFDEAAGNKVYDQTDNGRHGDLASNEAWIKSTAPVGEHPGIRRSSFVFENRLVIAGCSAILYYQQEPAATGYNATAKPIKRNARVMFVVPTIVNGGIENGKLQPEQYIAALDLAVSRDGNLAEIPDTLALPYLDKPMEGNGPTGGIEEFDQLTRWIADLEQQIHQQTHISIVGSANGTVQVSKTYGIGSYNQQPFSEFSYQLEMTIPQSLQVTISGEFLTQGNQPSQRFSETIPGGGAVIRFDDRYVYIDRLQVERSDSTHLNTLYQKLKDHRDRLQKIKDSLREEVRLPMSLQYVDANGLTVLGALLKFAYTDRAPYLFEGSDGKLGLYFKGQSKDQFFAAYYNILAGRPTFVVNTLDVSEGSVDKKPVTFLSRSAGTVLQNSKITISQTEPADPSTCKVTIENLQLGTHEIWTRVPRQPQKFANVLNGNMQPSYVGKLVSSASNQLTLEGRAQQAIAAGATLLVGDRQIKVITQGSVAVLPPVTAPLPSTVLELDGIDDFVELAKAADLGLLEHDFTVSAWVSISDITNPTGNGDRPILGTDKPKETNKGLHLVVRNGKPQMGFYNNDLLGNTLLAENTWYYLTWRYTKATKEQAMFVNGVLDRSLTERLPFQGTETINIGRWNGDRYFKGQIAKVCIWSEARSKQQIVADMRRTNEETAWLEDPTLQGCWYFERQGSQIIARDHSPYKRNGLLQGQPRLRQVETGTTTIEIIPTDLSTLVKAGEPVYLLPYDYDANVQTNQNSDRIQNGSRWFNVDPGSATEYIQDGEATSGNQGADCHWFADSQGTALKFDRTSGLTAESEAAYVANDDLTLEVWVKPEVFPPLRSTLICHQSTDSSYLLELGHNGTDYNAIATINGHVVEMLSHTLVGKWAHVAVTFKQSYALQFNKTQSVDCGSDLTLNLDGDLTIEAMIQPTTLKGAILSKGKSSEGIPYLFFLEDGKLHFRFEEDEQGNVQSFSSADSETFRFQPNQFYKVAVTREKRVGVDDQGKTNESWNIAFYVTTSNGPKILLAEHTYRGANPRGSDYPCLIGQSEMVSGFSGAISEVRLWNRARTQAEIFNNIASNEKGLVSWWRFEEKQGNIVYDSKGNNHGTRKGAVWVKTPDPQASEINLYLNGEKQKILSFGQQTPISQVSQFTLGAVKTSIGFDWQFQGEMDEVRVWKVARTEEQIQDNLFRRLMGDFEHLIAYFDCERANSLTDQSGRGLTIPIPPSKLEQWFVLSNAPISHETAKVRNAISSIETEFHETALASSPGVQEYGDIQTDINGNLIGVMKRCYSYIDRAGKWHLITGFKVGDLELEWIGQAQYEPQLIGFIEGAPPVPSENLTVRDANQGEIYEQASAIELIEADNVIYNYAESRDRGIETALSLRAGLGFKSKTDVGFGVTTSVEDTNMVVGITGHMETSNSWLSDQQVSVGRSTTKMSRLSLQGEWEAEIQYPQMGRRYVPKNVGFALVQSETADVFALRLKHREPSRRITVALKMRPNPDIPKDWNIIIFPLNPTYVKQGTLDGKVGGLPEKKHYHNAVGYSSDRSYFKPIEAYRLKSQIEKEQKELETAYQNFVTTPGGMNGGMGALAKLGAASGAGALVGASLGSAIDGGIAFNAESRLPDPAKLKRNLFNTYVWTADGGLFSETQQTMTVKQEVTAGAFSLSGMAGLYSDINTAISKVAVSVELEALMGGHLSLTTQKSQTSQNDFGINVELDVERNITIQSPEQADLVKVNRLYDPEGNRLKCPGKVDAYRFMTFYLEPSQEHFKDFENKVIDRAWLEQSSDPNAIALRQAVSTKSGTPWRVLHRVTYVSRVLPESAASETAPTDQLLRAANIESNWELIKKLDPFVKAKSSNYTDLKQAVEQAIDLHLPELANAKADIVNYMSLYYQVFRDTTA